MRKFSPEERGIFSYFDPDKAPRDSEGNILNDGMVSADPFEIENRWAKAKLHQKTDIDADFKNLELKAPDYDPNGSDPDPFAEIKIKSLRNILPFIHEVFDTKPLQPDNSGITFEEAFDNLERWGDFSDRVKKNTDETPSLVTSSQESKETLKHGKNTGVSVPTS